MPTMAASVTPDTMPGGLFVWYGQRSYFYPHWYPWLKERGFRSLSMCPEDKVSNSTILSDAMRQHGVPPVLLMSVGEQPFDLPTLRSLPAERSVAFTTDDEWRFYRTGRYLTRYFDWVATNLSSRMDDYAAHGAANVLPSGYAANTSSFRRLGIRKKHDVVMIGAPHPDRVGIARRVLGAGVDLHLFGVNWGRYPDLRPAWGGVLSQDGMVEALNTARIVVNPGLTVGGLPQVKGRLFETAACGSFQLTDSNPRLAEFYEDGREIVTFAGLDDLLQKIEHYLKHDSEREAIAEAGYRKTRECHSWERRLQELLDAVNGDPPPRPRLPETPVLVFGLAGSRPEDDVATVGGRFLEYDGGDVRPTLESSLRESSDVFLAFAEPGVSYDQDRLWLMAFGLQHDRQRGRFMNLAPFDVTDGRGRVYACSFIDTIATADFSLVPWSSVMVSGRALVERDGSHGPLTLERLRASMLPDMVIDGQTESIDLGTGLFTTRGRGRFGFMNIYRQSVSGLWDVRTRAYGRRVWRSGSCLAALNLASALVARQRERARQRAVPQ